MHYDIRMNDRSGNIFMICMIGVRHICQSQELPNFNNIRKRFPWLPEGSIERPRTKIGILLGQNANVLLPGCEEDVRFGNIRIRRSRLGNYSYIPDESDECLWNFKTTRKNYILHIFPHKVTLSSLFSLPPDLPRNLLPQFNPCKAVPPLLWFVEEGYAKIVRS